MLSVYRCQDSSNSTFYMLAYWYVNYTSTHAHNGKMGFSITVAEYWGLSLLHSVSQKPKRTLPSLRANEFLFVSELFLTWCLLPEVRTALGEIRICHLECAKNTVGGVSPLPGDSELGMDSLKEVSWRNC